jgi:hypothetical protein
MGFTLREGSRIARTELTIDMVMQGGAQKEVRGGRRGRGGNIWRAKKGPLETRARIWAA